MRKSKASGSFKSCDESRPFGVVECIGEREYVYNVDGERGCKQLAPGRGFDNRKTQTMTLKLDSGKEYQTRSSAVAPLYRMPDREKVKAWTEGAINAKSGGQIWNALNNYFETFLDLKDPQDRYFLSLAVLESWVIDLLPSCFYICLMGEPGAGKTSALEHLALLCRHGKLCSDITGAGIARLIGEQDLSLIIDELDQGDQETGDYQLKLSLLRAGYRRNNPFLRLSRKYQGGFEMEEISCFGFKAFSAYQVLDPALESRCFTINMESTEDCRPGVINTYKSDLSKELFHDLLFWRLENLHEVRERLPGLQAMKADFYKQGFNPGKARQNLSNAATVSMTKQEREALKESKGRESELIYVVMLIDRLYALDILPEIIGRQEKRKRASAKKKI